MNTTASERPLEQDNVAAFRRALVEYQVESLEAPPLPLSWWERLWPWLFVLLVVAAMGLPACDGVTAYAQRYEALRAQQGLSRCYLSANPYEYNSTSNPFGPCGSPYSEQSPNNPYGRGLPL
jgi:hypothetical protein